MSADSKSKFRIGSPKRLGMNKFVRTKSHKGRLTYSQK